ncbi:hypothetical protein ACLIBG_04025 [Virgibacillus sp. W0181]|uniref:hypothetical protein n=1 Tax=Virgibacillus sp. W0181 TaxID=3391581 RepID=UPI003F46AFB1
MVRAFIVILLFALFFLSGMVFGIDQNKQSADKNVEVVEKEEELMDDTPIIVEELVPEQAAVITGQEHFIQKVASFLEKGVRAFYELVVHVMYQFTKLFFE